MFHTIQHEAAAETDTGTTDPATAAAQAAAADTPAAGAGGDSLIAAAAASTKPALERIPEKYQVKKDDGTLDPDASWAKFVDGHEALQKKLGSGDLAPEKPDDYKLDPPKDAEGKPIEGLDFEAFTKDPLFQSFQKAAHAKGLTNAQLQFVTERYLELAPQLFSADQALTADEAKAELGRLWADEGAMKSNLASVVRAINAFGGQADDMPGSRARLMEKYGTDPDFIAFAPAIGAETKEDRVPLEGAAASDVEIEALQKSEAYWKPSHPDHAATKAKVAAYYARKFGTAPHR